MENKEKLLTNELYESIIGDLVKEVVKLKKEQGETINKISVETETLKLLKEQVKQLKKDIKNSKKILHTEKTNLSQINNNLSEKNHMITDLNYSFITEEDRYVDLDEFAVEQTKKR